MLSHSASPLETPHDRHTIADMPQAGHGMMLSPLPPLGSTDSIAYQLLSDPPGFDRGQLPALHQKVADFFKSNLPAP
jgi:hypothetical protein